MLIYSKSSLHRYFESIYTNIDNKFFRLTKTIVEFSENEILFRGAFNKFPDFFVQAFKIVVDSWIFSWLLLYILWDDWPIFMVSGSNEQLQQQLEYTLLKPDCHSWWLSKMQSGREDTLEVRYAIKFCLKLGKKMLPQKRMECFRLLLEHLAWIEHLFSGMGDWRKAGNLWGMMRGMGGVRKSVHQSWLAKGLGLGLRCWDFKWVQEEIRSDFDMIFSLSEVVHVFASNVLMTVSVDETLHPRYYWIGILEIIQLWANYLYLIRIHYI